MTWAPFASGRTTLRGSAGIFYDWLPTSTYDQSLRVDGVRQQELNIVNPAFPDPGNRRDRAAGQPLPAGQRLQRAANDTLQRGHRSGIWQADARRRRPTAISADRRLSRGLNLNPLVNGVGRDPAFANIVEVVSDAASRQHQLQVDANINPGALLPAFNGPLVSWKRTTVFVNYTLATLRNNTDGPFSIPPTGNLADEWGPANGGLAASGPFFGDASSARRADARRPQPVEFHVQQPDDSERAGRRSI